MFHLSIVTPEKSFYEGQIKSLIVPGTEGYLGVLSQHAPLITALIPGKIEFRDENDEVNIMAVSGGFLEVSNNIATILADTVERADDIDIDRAKASYERE
ncbi:MAG: ATP synthase F1 subunit epsilon, partial [Candidatus Zixiibacteriota bacterium]